MSGKSIAAYNATLSVMLGEKDNSMNNVNQGELCFNVMLSLLDANNGKISVEEAVSKLESIGWKHSLISYRQKRKHLYEVLRFNGKRGRTTAKVIGEEIILNPDTVEITRPLLEDDEATAFVNTLFRWQPIKDGDTSTFKVTVTDSNIDMFTLRLIRNVSINGVFAGAISTNFVPTAFHANGAGDCPVVFGQKRK